MKKLILATGLCGLLALTGCNNDNDNFAGQGQDGDGVYHRSGNTINVNDEQPELYNEDRNKHFKDKRDDFGYVRLMGDNKPTEQKVLFDREQLAKMISQYSTDLPNVEDVSTLVTSREVLVVYKTDSKNRVETADQVKRTAMSVVPRFYHVYVTDNTHLRQDVQNFATLDTDSPNINKAIDSVIQRMKKSPQGRGLDGENANGETADEQVDRSTINKEPNNNGNTTNRTLNR